jgi:hypothetical protein
VKSDRRYLDPSGRFENHLVLAAFVRRGDEEDRPAVTRTKDLYLRRAATVDESGLARWDIRPLDATVGSLVRAGESGLVDGDPLRPYLILAVPAGDLGVVGTSWSAFQEAFGILWAVVSAAGTGYSAIQALSAIKARLGGTRSVLDSRQGEWAGRGARPSDLPFILGAKPRSSADIAALLGCSESEAGALLWGLGFQAGDDGLWRLVFGSGSQAEADVLRVVRNLLEGTPPVSQEALRAEVEEILDAGTEREARGKGTQGVSTACEGTTRTDDGQRTGQA